MSYSKNDQVFPGAAADKIEQEMVRAITKALRDDHQGLHSAVKQIGRKTGIHLRAIRNWYEGRNTPNSVHLLILAYHYPGVLRIILEIAGRADLGHMHLPATPLPRMAALSKETDNHPYFYGDNSITINVGLDARIARRLNKRQLWFIGKLQKKERVRAADIASTWRVALRTAKRDIALLVKMKAIDFVGDNRMGYYQLLK